MVEEDSDGSDDSLLCIQVVRKNRKLMSTIRASINESNRQVQFQIDTGASCNILNHKDYVNLGKPVLDNNQSKLKQFDGSITRALGGCELEVAGKKLYFLVHKTRNHSLLSGDA
jgi:hypothetical protein